MLIDAHQHFWDLEQVAYPWLGPEHGVLYRTHTPEELAPQLKAAGVEATILVQAANSRADTVAMLQVADRLDWVGAVVGWIDLTADARRLLAEIAHPKLRGVRHLVHDESDPDWLAQPGLDATLVTLAARDLVFEVPAVYPHHLGHVADIAARHPALRIVIDHLGKPPIGTDLAGWQRSLSACAAHPNVLAKISGLTTITASGRASDPSVLRPAIATAVELFGSDRLMVGSNWPVCRSASEYAVTIATTLAALPDLDDDQLADLRGLTAARLYRLPAQVTS